MPVDIDEVLYWARVDAASAKAARDNGDTAEAAAAIEQMHDILDIVDARITATSPEWLLPKG